MRISPINAQYYNGYNKVSTNNHVTSAVTGVNNTVQTNPLHFSGWFRKKDKDDVPFAGDEHGMSGNDYTVSFKVADVLHRLDKESILVIGHHNGLWVKGIVEHQLTNEDSKLKDPKSIKNVYIVDHDTVDPIIIQKIDKDKFSIYGPVCNLTKPDALSKEDGYKYHHGYDASYGDVVELKSNLKIKFFKFPKESNVPMFDAKYPIESFFTHGPTLEGGLVIKKNNDKNTPDMFYGSLSDSKYGQPIPERTFDDVAGLDDTVEYMKEKLLYPILYPNAFKDEPNHGMILYGPPGTGKTLLALATIGEVKKRQNRDVHFVKINSRDLEQQYVGVTEGMWREVFQELEDNQPSILFIDEIDALMGDRNSMKDSSHNSMTSTVSQLLQCIDNLEKTDAQVWIIGATNRFNTIDPAIKRSGRLGDSYEVKRPNVKGCRAILDLYLRDKNVSEEFDRDNFAKSCYDLEYTGSDIAQIVHEAKRKMYKRCGIMEKMDNGTYSDRDLMYTEYTKDDFDEALKTQQINKELRRKIGFDK